MRTKVGWDIRTWQEILLNLVATLRPQVDVLALLSHLGIEEDQGHRENVRFGLDYPGSHTSSFSKRRADEWRARRSCNRRTGLYVGGVVILAATNGVERCRLC